LTDHKKKLTALDRSFLAWESRDVMMHVGGLLEFSPTKHASLDLSRELRDELSKKTAVEAPFDVRLLHPDLLASPLQAWVPDENLDVEYHVRRSALPQPGDERELGILVSRLHGTPLDFHRPPWEAHFIEGLEGKRLAVYFKVHHALLDGYTGSRILSRSLSTDPTEVDAPLFFSRAPLPKKSRSDGEYAPTFDALLHGAREQIGAAKDVGRAVMNAVRARRARDKDLALPLQAPRSVLNQRITRSRRIATQQVELQRIRAIATAAGGTMNDVVLALCGAALRRFLADQDRLPERPLVAMVPVNVRPKDDPGGGNAVGAILASLATDETEPEKAMAAIIASTRRAKAQLQGMSKSAIIQYSGLILAPLMLAFVPGAVGRIRPAFNVVISNVPGPEEPLYFRGWRLDASYPLSIPFHGYGLNITVQSYAGSLNFGFTGCRDTLPHLQRLAVHAGEAVDELERVFCR
jgi:WS/DGAT/MGAT family acyltransferase